MEILLLLCSGIALLSFLFVSLSVVVIGEDEVGIVIRRFGKELPPGHLIALNNEAGYQADTLPPGWHFGYWRWQYKIIEERVIVIPQGQIGLILSASGESIPPERILGHIVDCDHFQDARKFL